MDSDDPNLEIESLEASPEEQFLRKNMMAANQPDNNNINQKYEFIPTYTSQAEITDKNLEFQKLNTLNTHIRNDKFSSDEKVLLIYH